MVSLDFKGCLLVLVYFDLFNKRYLQILHLKGDRKDFDFVKSSLSAEGFDVVYDINGTYFLIYSSLLFGTFILFFIF